MIEEINYSRTNWRYLAEYIKYKTIQGTEQYFLQHTLNKEWYKKDKIMYINEQLIYMHDPWN